MSAEISEQFKVAIVLTMFGAFLGAMINVFISATPILNLPTSDTAQAIRTVNVQTITSLKFGKHTYPQIYKTFATSEVYINSVTGIDEDGTVCVHYLRNANIVDRTSNTYNKCTNTYTGTPNIDTMYTEFLSKYCGDEYASCKLKCYVTKTTDGQFYDIYYQVIE